MTMTDEEEFFAWLDGELEGEAAEKVAARVAADPELAEEARLHRALGQQLRGAFDPLMAAPVPDRIGQRRWTSRPRGSAAPRAASPCRNGQRSRRPWWSASSAGRCSGQMRRDPVAQQGATIVAAGALERALDTQLASAPTSGGVRIGLTFRDSAGAVCRSFDDRELSGLACRAGDEWKFRGLFQKSVEGKATIAWRQAPTHGSAR